MGLLSCRCDNPGGAPDGGDLVLSLEPWPLVGSWLLGVTRSPDNWGLHTHVDQKLLFRWRIQILINEGKTLLKVFGNWEAKWREVTALSSNYRKNWRCQKCSYSGTSINKTHGKHACLQENHVWENTKQNDYKSQSSCTAFSWLKKTTVTNKKTQTINPKPLFHSLCCVLTVWSE